MESKLSDFVDFFNFQVSFCGHGRTIQYYIDTWPVTHHSSNLCVMITFLVIPLNFELAKISNSSLKVSKY